MGESGVGSSRREMPYDDDDDDADHYNTLDGTVPPIVSPTGPTARRDVVMPRLCDPE